MTDDREKALELRVKYKLTLKIYKPCSKCVFYKHRSCKSSIPGVQQSMLEKHVGNCGNHPGIYVERSRLGKYLARIWLTKFVTEW